MYSSRRAEAARSSASVRHAIPLGTQAQVEDLPVAHVGQEGAPG